MGANIISRPTANLTLGRTDTGLDWPTPASKHISFAFREHSYFLQQ
jgi:hypothetical protein